MAGGQLNRFKSWCSSAEWGSAPWQRVVTAVVAALLFQAISATEPPVGLDPSWESALALARSRDLDWGPEIVFTAGPLGFLHNPGFYYYGQSVLATGYQVIVLVALFLGIAAALRQRYAPTAALLGAFLTTGFANLLIASLYPDLAVLAAFAWAIVPLLGRDAKRSRVFATCITLGAVAGFQFLVKVNSGPMILAIALTLSLLSDWRALGRHSATVAAFVTSTVVWWLLAGQPIAELPVWLRLSVAVASGYVDAMAVPLFPFAIPSVLLALGWIAAICLLFVRRRPDIPRRFVVLVLLVSLIVAKTAFGRFDAGHIFILLSLIVVATVVTPSLRRRERSVALVAVVLVYLGLAGPLPLIRTEAIALSPVRAVQRLFTLATPGQWDRRVEESKARQRAQYAIPARFLDTIGSAPIHVDPSEASAVWAYNLGWHPTPVFQTYSAYTPMLDALNRDTLANGPQHVLSRISSDKPAKGIDGRLAVQESPLYSRALLCNYELKGIENQWALFERVHSHCGQLTGVSETSVHDNETITVPSPSQPGKAVLVSLDLDQNLCDRLFQGTVAPLSNFTVALDGVTYRLVAANAAEPFLLSSPRSLDGTNMEIHAHTIAVGRHTSLGDTSASARLRFYEMTVG